MREGKKAVEYIYIYTRRWPFSGGLRVVSPPSSGVDLPVRVIGHCLAEAATYTERDSAEKQDIPSAFPSAQLPCAALNFSRRVGKRKRVRAAACESAKLSKVSAWCSLFSESCG